MTAVPPLTEAATYDPRTTAEFYDRFAEREWARLAGGTFNKIHVLTHQTMLAAYVKLGDRVLEAGAGPGRFTIELAQLGARIHVGDISKVQLELNARNVADAGHEASVIGRDHLDIVDLSRFADGAFDVAVCFGGALGCVLDQADRAARELLRVVRPGGHLLVSVTSRHGFLRNAMPDVLHLAQSPPMLAALDACVTSGDDLGLGRELRLTSHLFSWAELAGLLERSGGKVVDGSAANFLSSIRPDLDEKLLENPGVREAFYRWELAACRAPGAYDSGTHMIAVAQRG